ncbi:hypothetical protein PGT21_031801 [Puccinia graminis f. sp. tritici]|uniref:Uncharacterized protein n=1 Tax=Puccinia graminis f. sp. tritici TaxID=56615 RepID=A0A5B0Q7C4_PUCGR|nr:hypothetical protein PGT21_031801 [Puccinia graminis f. sp. tritici]
MMVKNLAGSEALVTTKEHLRNQILVNVRFLSIQNGFPEVIEKVATDKAILEIDNSLASPATTPAATATATTAAAAASATTTSTARPRLDAARSPALAESTPNLLVGPTENANRPLNSLSEALARINSLAGEIERLVLTVTVESLAEIGETHEIRGLITEILKMLRQANPTLKDQLTLLLAQK